MKFKAILIAILFCVGFWQLSVSGYMLAKAWYSQYLIESAWEQSLEDKQYHKPWSWDDTHPIALLNLPRLEENKFILAGSSGRNLAFSATHLIGSGMPGELKSTIISGHNDSHFSFLKDVLIGDEIKFTTLKKTYKYRIINLQVINSSDNQINILNRDELVLTTCYPFDSLSINGDLRYVVHALPVT